jgi:predicted CXXCH cytochrome family protein
VRLATVLALGLALLATTARAAGGHDPLGCVGCHAMHASRGDLLTAVPPNLKLPERRTGKPHGPLTALCLGCHADPADGGKGIASISNHMLHPFSLAEPNLRVARVPAELLRDGRFECVSCHDPHPSNPNYRYLRVPSRTRADLTQVCSLCHVRKADPNYVPPRLFSSMDEQTPAAAGR